MKISLDQLVFVIIKFLLEIRINIYHNGFCLVPKESLDTSEMMILRQLLKFVFFLKFVFNFFKKFFKDVTNESGKNYSSRIVIYTFYSWYLFKIPCNHFSYFLCFKGANQAGIVESIYQSVECCPEELREALYANIMLCGGNSKIPNFRERIWQELRTLIPDVYELNISVFDEYAF